MRNIELKFIADDTSKAHVQSIANLLEWMTKKCNCPLSYSTVTIFSGVIDDAKKLLSETYECSIRDGVSGGCYGARDGSQSAGFTVWLHAKHLIDRYIDADYGEQANPWSLLNEYGQAVEHDGDIDGLVEMFGDLGLRVRSDNTCNFAADFGGPDSENAGFMYDFQFDVIENENDCDADAYLAVMFHCGGDTRGNYTDKMLFKFSSIDDVHSVIYPTKFLSDDQEAI